MENVTIEALYGKRIDCERLYDRIRQLGPEANPRGDVVLAFVIDQLIERIEKLETKLAEPVAATDAKL